MFWPVTGRLPGWTPPEPVGTGSRPEFRCRTPTRATRVQEGDLQSPPPLPAVSGRSAEHPSPPLPSGRRRRRPPPERCGAIPSPRFSMNFPMGPSGSVDSSSSTFVCPSLKNAVLTFWSRHLFDRRSTGSQNLLVERDRRSRFLTAMPMCSICVGFMLRSSCDPRSMRHSLSLDITRRSAPCAPRRPPAGRIADLAHAGVCVTASRISGIRFVSAEAPPRQRRQRSCRWILSAPFRTAERREATCSRLRPSDRREAGSRAPLLLRLILVHPHHDSAPLLHFPRVPVGGTAGSPPAHTPSRSPAPSRPGRRSFRCTLIASRGDRIRHRFDVVRAGQRIDRVRDAAFVATICCVRSAVRTESSVGSASASSREFV